MSNFSLLKDYPIHNNQLVMDKMDIELEAENFSLNFRPSRKNIITPLFDFISTLISKHDLAFKYADLGTNSLGSKILGLFKAAQNTIIIDKSLQTESLIRSFRFVIAHELGHWFLHRHRLLDSCDEHDTFNSTQQTQWFEWQANKFAAALLMPTYKVKAEVCNISTRIGIKRNLGKILLGNDDFYQRDYQIILNELCKEFQVSHTSMKIRLQELEIVIDGNVNKYNSSEEEDDLSFIKKFVQCAEDNYLDKS